jgi:hypothetical protein
MSASPTIEAAMLYTELTERGVTLYREGDKLRFRPLSKVSKEEVERLKENKAELLDLLSFYGKEQSATSATSATQERNSDTYGESVGGTSGGRCSGNVPPLVKRHLDEAKNLGLVARWASEFGYISIHDPTTGEWHALPTADAPAWAKKESFKRKELRGRYGSRLLTRYQMERIWQRERDEADALDRGTPAAAVSDRGILFEDYIADDE